MTDVLFTRSFQRDPYPVYRWLRDHEPCHAMTGQSGYALSRYADVSAALFMDPPGHGRLRRKTAGPFTPGQVASLGAIRGDALRLCTSG